LVDYDFPQIIKLQYLNDSAEADFYLSQGDVQKFYGDRIGLLVNSILSRDLTYFINLLRKQIALHFAEDQIKNEKFEIPAVPEAQLNDVLETLINEEVAFVTRLTADGKTSEPMHNVLPKSLDIRQWINECRTAEQLESISKSRGRGRTSAEWEAIKNELLRLEALGSLPKIKNNRRKIGKILWNWCEANGMAKGFQGPAAAPKTIADDPIIKYELDRIERSEQTD
jgi:hypothetical protein